jgi:hypothetical protein
LPVIRFIERATRNQLRAHRIEVAGQNEVHVRLLELRRIGGGFLRAPPCVGEAASSGRGDAAVTAVTPGSAFSLVSICCVNALR